MRALFKKVTIIRAYNSKPCKPCLASIAVVVSRDAQRRLLRGDAAAGDRSEGGHKSSCFPRARLEDKMDDISRGAKCDHVR